MPCGATQDGQVMVERSDRMWSTGERNGKSLQYSCLENPMNSMKREKDRILKDKLPRSVVPNMLLEISGEITPESSTLGFEKLSILYFILFKIKFKSHRIYLWYLIKFNHLYEHILRNLEIIFLNWFTLIKSY